MNTDSDIIDFWININYDITSLNNIKYKNNHPNYLDSQQSNYIFFKSFKDPISDIKCNIHNNNYDINHILDNHISTYIDHNVHLSGLFDKNLFKFIKFKSVFDFYNDLTSLNKLNYNYSFIDSNDKKKIIFTIVIFISIIGSSFMINKSDDDMETIYKNNPLILFYTACYLFFDYLFDDININKNIKKNIVKYVNNIFDDVKNINNYIDDHNIKKYIDSINNIFIILFNYEKQKYPILYYTLKHIFNVEASTSKFQTYNDKCDFDLNKILECTLLKGRETINGVWQICNINFDFKQNKEYLLLMNHLGFIFQLLDDLIDIEQDVIEKNVTIFSYIFLYNQKPIKYDKIDLINNVVKLINYVYEFNNILDSIDINIMSQKHKHICFYILLLMLNYGISKNDILKNEFIKYEYLFPLKFDDIINFRQNKYTIF